MPEIGSPNPECGGVWRNFDSSPHLTHHSPLKYFVPLIRRILPLPLVCLSFYVRGVHTLYPKLCLPLQGAFLFLNPVPDQLCFNFNLCSCMCNVFLTSLAPFPVSFPNDLSSYSPSLAPCFNPIYTYSLLFSLPQPVSNLLHSSSLPPFVVLVYLLNILDQ